MPKPKINDFVRKRVGILDFKKLTEDVCEITLEKPSSMTHKPGQFLTVIIPAKDRKIVFRAYSVMLTSDNKLQITVKVVEGGVGSNFLFNQKKGNKLGIIYPLGYFGLPDQVKDDMFFIATGTGIVPVLSLVESFPKDFENNIKIVFGVREEKDLFYEERIKSLKNRFKNFSSVITLSRPTESWEGSSGRVTAHLEDIKKDAQYFMCGSGAMIREVRDILKNKKVSKKDVCFEDFNE